MTHNITHAAWMNPLDNGQWEDWNPAWIKAVMDHLQVDTEEDIAGVFATTQHPDPDERLETHEYIQPGYKDREVVPYEGLSIGTLRFGHCFVNGVRVPCCTDLHGGGHPETLYVAADNVRGLPTPFHADDPETGLPVDYPGPGAEGNCLPHTPARTEDPAPTHQLPCLGTVQQYESYGLNNSKLVATNIFLPDNTVGITIDGGHVRIVTRVPCPPARSAPPANPTSPLEDKAPDEPCPYCRKPLTGDDILEQCPHCLRRVAWSSQSGYDKYDDMNPDHLLGATGQCDNCNVDVPATALLGTAYGHYCAACYPGEDSELPAGNVRPADLYTELFPEPDAP